jgi:hypothetical protein
VLSYNKIELTAAHTPNALDTWEFAAHFDRSPLAAENLQFHVNGRRAADGVWETFVSSGALAGAPIMTALQAPTVFNAYDRIAFSWTGTLASQLQIESFSVTPQGSLTNTVDVTPTAALIGDYDPIYRERTHEIADEMRWNAMIVWINIIGDAEVAGLGQAAFSRGNDKVVEADFGELPSRGCSYYGFNRMTDLYGEWLPDGRDMVFNGLHHVSNNKFRCCVKVTDPNATIRVRVCSEYEFPSNAAWDPPIPFPSRILTPSERQDVQMFVGRLPCLGENPSHAQRITKELRAFGKKVAAPALKAGAKVAVPLLLEGLVALL